ncbi:unnamed protein product [Phaeothamnion confervicola]
MDSCLSNIHQPRQRKHSCVAGRCTAVCRNSRFEHSGNVANSRRLRGGCREHGRRLHQRSHRPLLLSRWCRRCGGGGLGGGCGRLLLALYRLGSAAHLRLEVGQSERHKHLTRAP